MHTLHENNMKVIAKWTAKDYANKYREYLDTPVSVESWFCEFMPEHEESKNAHAFCRVCEKFHNMGF